MRIFSYLLFFITAQGISAQMFNKGYVKVPDCVEQLLVDSYGGEEPNAGKFVVNLLDINNTNFCNGVFAFKGQGVHCPRKIFLNKDGLIYIFSSHGFEAPKKVLQEYIECSTALQLTNNEFVAYLYAIYRYLDEERGMTYGIEIKSDEYNRD